MDSKKLSEFKKDLLNLEKDLEKQAYKKKIAYQDYKDRLKVTSDLVLLINSLENKIREQESFSKESGLFPFLEELSLKQLETYQNFLRNYKNFIKNQKNLIQKLSNYTSKIAIGSQIGFFFPFWFSWLRRKIFETDAKLFQVKTEEENLNTFALKLHKTFSKKERFKSFVNSFHFMKEFFQFFLNIKKEEQNLITKKDLLKKEIKNMQLMLIYHRQKVLNYEPKKPKELEENVSKNVSK